jgi:hypothetical protein
MLLNCFCIYFVYNFFYVIGLWRNKLKYINNNNIIFALETVSEGMVSMRQAESLFPTAE